MAKLTEEKAQEIRRRAALGESFKSLAMEFGVSDVMIRLVVRRKNWTHVE